MQLGSTFSVTWRSCFESVLYIEGGKRIPSTCTPSFRQPRKTSNLFGPSVSTAMSFEYSILVQDNANTNILVWEYGHHHNPPNYKVQTKEQKRKSLTAATCHTELGVNDQHRHELSSSWSRLYFRTMKWISLAHLSVKDNSTELRDRLGEPSITDQERQIMDPRIVSAF